MDRNEDMAKKLPNCCNFGGSMSLCTISSRPTQAKQNTCRFCEYEREFGVIGQDWCAQIRAERGNIDLRFRQLRLWSCKNRFARRLSWTGFGEAETATRGGIYGNPVNLEKNKGFGCLEE
jgi:hypothetical protein